MPEEPQAPEEIEFQIEEPRLFDILRHYPEPVTFEIPTGGATSLRVRLRRALTNFITHPDWPSSLDRGLAHKVLSSYTFVADDKHHVYCGFPRRTRIPSMAPVSVEIPIIETENVEVLKAVLLLKNYDHIPIPIRVKTALPIHEIKTPYVNTEIAESILENNYTII